MSDNPAPHKKNHHTAEQTPSPRTAPLKQNSSYSVAKQYQNNTKTNQKKPPNNKTTQKTTPNKHPPKK